ncbi:MAG: glycoside hydrolase family 3 protein [Bacilli bacterium]
MKKIVVVICFILFFSGCDNKSNNKTEPINPTIEEQITIQINNMSIEEKVAQMFVVSYRKEDYDSTLDSMLRTYKPGGFILFGENMSTYEKTLDFIKNIKKTSSIPYFIGIDEEGGSVQRLLSLRDVEATNFPFMLRLGNMNDISLVKETAGAMASELKVFGINTDFAPCLDIFSNSKNTTIGYRAFGRDALSVIKYGITFGQSLEENDIIPVYKHFPGHGDSLTDSHNGVVVSYKNLDELKRVELLPFIRAAQEEVPMIMVSHISYPNITLNNEPTSLSKIMINDILRTDLGYKGIIITDAVNMAALSNYYTPTQIYEKAINAGVDIILMPNDLGKAIEDIKLLIKDNIISEERIDLSVKKILLLKRQKIINNYDKYEDVSHLGSIEHKNIINKIK